MVRIVKKDEEMLSYTAWKIQRQNRYQCDCDICWEWYLRRFPDNLSAQNQTVQAPE